MRGVDRFIYLFCFFVSIQLILGYAVWEFGRNKKGSEVIAHYHGEMTISQKSRNVKLAIPECMKIIFVQVEVENDFTTPEVRFNWTTTTVGINYKKSQKSISYYDVVGRAIRDKDCGGSKQKKLSFKNKFITKYTGLRALGWWPRLGKRSVRGLLSDGGTTYTRGQATTGCIKQQTGLCGVPSVRPMSSSGLQLADDDVTQVFNNLNIEKVNM